MGEDGRLTIEVTGRPVPWKRPSRYGGNVFNPSKRDEKDFSAAVIAICQKNLGSTPKFGSKDLLSVQLQFFYPCKEDATIEEKISILKSADVDNLSKMVLDSLNTVLYEDDSQIIKLRARKCIETSLPSTAGRTLITLQRITSL